MRNYLPENFLHLKLARKKGSEPVHYLHLQFIRVICDQILFRSFTENVLYYQNTIIKHGQCISLMLI